MSDELFVDENDPCNEDCALSSGSDYIPTADDCNSDENNNPTNNEDLNNNDHNTKINLQEESNSHQKSYSIDSSFKFELTPGDWESIEIVSNQRGERRLGGNWTDLFSQKVQEYNPYCPLSYKLNRVKRLQSRKTKVRFFTGAAVCKFNNCCKYKFTIKKGPKPGRSSKVKAVVENNIHEIKHETGIFKGRPIARERRKDAAKEALACGSSSAFYKHLGSVPSDVITVGNKSNFGTKDVFRKLASEARLSERLHTDVFNELAIQKQIFDKTEEAEHIKGKIQSLSLFPFKVYMYTEQQLRILHEHCRTGSGVLYFDATGEVVRKIPNQQKRVFYYPLLIKGKTGFPPLPVAEMITNSHNTVDVTTFLMTLNRDFRLLYPNGATIQRIEIDFSWPFIHGILLAFNNESLQHYLNKVWNYHVNNHTLENTTIIHICSAHILHRVAKHVSTHTEDKSLKRFILYVFGKIINSTTLKEIDGVFTNLCILLLCKNESDHPNFNEARCILDNLVVGIGVLEPDENYCDILETEDSQEKPMSLFSAHFNCLYTNINHSITDNNNADITNPYYSPETVSYILKTYMHLVPLWTGLLFTENITHDTNSPAELWMRIVKLDILKGNMRQTPGRFILLLYENIKGRINEYYMNNYTKASNKRREKLNTYYSAEEKWGGKQKRKKGVYLKSPTKSPKPKKRVRVTKHGESALHWGGRVIILGQTIDLTNTCPIDNLLILVYELMKKPNICDWFKEHTEFELCKTLLEIRDLFAAGQWRDGRNVWITRYLGQPPGQHWNIWGSEAEKFVKYYVEIQQISRRRMCSKRRCYNKEIMESTGEIILGCEEDTFTSLQDSINQWQNGKDRKCNNPEGGRTCTGIRRSVELQFKNDQPPLLILSVSLLAQMFDFSYSNMPMSVELFGDVYEIFGYTVCLKGHFISYFRRGVNWYFYNGLDDPEIMPIGTPPENVPVTDISISFKSNSYRLTNKTLQIENGSTLVISCQPNNDASPAPNIRLYYINNNVDILKNTTDHYLETSLTVTMEMDGSTLYCRDNNSKQLVEASTLIKMQVLVPLTDISISFKSNSYRLTNNILQIENGSTLVIGCQPNNDASPAPTIRLYKNGIDIQRTTGHHLKTYLTVTMEMNGLELQCVANNSKQFKRSPVIKLEVPDSTTMSLRVNNVTDNKIILQCKVDGRPNNYTFSPWKHYLNGVLIREVKGYLENEDDYIYYLNISTQLYKNRGVYVCSGSYGRNGQMYTHTTNTTIYLTASREPQRPEINIELIGGVIVSIVIILLVSFIIFMVVRKKQQMTTNQESLTYSGLQIGRGEGRLESDYDDLATYVNQGVAITSSNDPPVLGVNVQHPSDDQGVADTSRDGPPAPLAANASSDDLPVYIEVLNNLTYDGLQPINDARIYESLKSGEKTYENA